MVSVTAITRPRPDGPRTRRLFRGLPTEVIDADLLDGMYLRGNRPASDVDRLREVVAVALDGLGPDIAIAVPAGAGRPRRSSATRRVLHRLVPGAAEGRRYIAPHPDHLWLRDAGLTVAREHGRTVVIYEEIPHGMGFPADEKVCGLAAANGETATPVVMDPDLDEKVRRLGAYRSQLPLLFPPWLKGPLREVVPTAERYWVFEPV